MTKSAIPDSAATRRHARLVPLLLFGSGFCALIYQPGRYTAEALQPKR